ncbi:hypothetical protein B9Y75_20610 [Stenotrophomonas maltophilia]|nr:hypothetical protein B9Y75_20610 [Stenotrophomonas maltophilia]
MSRVVHVVEATATGTLTMVCAAANLSAARGINVHVIYSRRPETPHNVATLFHQDIRLHELPMGGPNALRAIWSLREKIVRLGPDIVHLHSSFAGFIGRLATFGILPKAKIFYSPHCISVMRQDIGGKRFIFAALERLANIRRCTYLACSMSEKNEILRWTGANAKLLENAVESVSTVESIDATPRNGPIKIVTAGGVRLQKGPEEFATIARACLEEGIDAEFKWIGDGELKAVDKLADSGVSITGWLPKTDVYAELKAADIYLSTARWEGLPVSIIEAMTSNTLVIASRCAGNVDVIDHERTGLLYSNPREAKEFIQSIINDSFDFNRIKRAANIEAKTRFSLTAFDKRLHELYGIPLKSDKTADHNEH